jgi:hypothetical protein
VRYLHVEQTPEREARLWIHRSRRRGGILHRHGATHTTVTVEAEIVMR